MSVVPIKYEEVVLLNEIIVSNSGETTDEEGVLNESSIRNCCDLLTNMFYGKEQFEGLMKKAAALLDCIARCHGFRNANKRSSISATNLFLHRNGWHFKPDDDAIDVTLRAARAEIKLDELERWILKCSHPKFQSFNTIDKIDY